MTRTLFVLPVAAIASAGCLISESTCIPGASLSCTCSSGVSGAQICKSDGTLGSCVCDSTGAGGGSTGTGGGGQNTGGRTTYTFGSDVTRTGWTGGAVPSDQIVQSLCVSMGGVAIG